MLLGLIASSVLSGSVLPHLSSSEDSVLDEPVGSSAAASLAEAGTDMEEQAEPRDEEKEQVGLHGGTDSKQHGLLAAAEGLCILNDTGAADENDEPPTAAVADEILAADKTAGAQAAVDSAGSLVAAKEGEAQVDIQAEEKNETLCLAFECEG